MRLLPSSSPPAAPSAWDDSSRYFPFGPTTVIEACIEYLRAGGIETVIVVVGQDSRAEELKQHLKDSQVFFAINPDPASEMSASIACGLREVPDSAKAILITRPTIPPCPLKWFGPWSMSGRMGARLVMPTNQGRGGHPVLVDLRFHDQLLDLDTSRGLKGFFDAHQGACQSRSSRFELHCA